MGTVLKCPKCGKVWWVGGGMFDDRKYIEDPTQPGPFGPKRIYIDGPDEIAEPAKDGKFYCKVCGVKLTSEGVPFILWD